MKHYIFKVLLLPMLTMMFIGCASSRPPLKTAEKVDLQRFMGRWHVIAHIPTAIEKHAYNAVEEYSLNADGTIQTTFTFNNGASDGVLKTYRPKGFVVDKVNNSTWGMQFIWPFKAEYLITYINSDYTQTIISRNKRDYVWIMARSPHMPEEDYTRLVDAVGAQEYDLKKLRKVPQQDHSN